MITDNVTAAVTDYIVIMCSFQTKLFGSHSSRPDTGAEYCDMYVSVLLCVCLSVFVRIRKLISEVTL